MPPKLLVTGASGFIGTHCILELLSHGYRVRGALRDLQRAEQIRAVLRKHAERADDIEFVRAELTDPSCWEEALQGCDGVLHLASPVPVVQPKDADTIIRPAREGVLNVLKAAKIGHVKRVVLTSSVAAVWGQGRHGPRVYTASDWTDPHDTDQSPYSLSKTIAEKAAWECVDAQGGPELAVINPSFVFGPALEPDYGSSLEILLRLLKGKFPLLPKLGFEMVDVRDVALLHRLAYECPQAAGKRFLCSSGFRWLKEIALVLKEGFPEYRKKISVRSMPNLLFRVLAQFDDSMARFAPDLDIKKEMETSAARKVLGWQPRPPEEAIISGARSLIELGAVSL